MSVSVQIADLTRVLYQVFEVSGLVCIVGGFLLALARTVPLLRARQSTAAYHTLRVTFGRSVLLGLEVLVAADLIRTIAVKLTLENVAVLGVLIGIRTFLSWSLEVEIDGRWPWQRPEEERSITK
ncbi:MAG: DUF1622 domain-containing protein [Coriobacteriia bacterium]